VIVFSHISSLRSIVLFSVIENCRRGVGRGSEADEVLLLPWKRSILGSFVGWVPDPEQERCTVKCISMNGVQS